MDRSRTFLVLALLAISPIWTCLARGQGSNNSLTVSPTSLSLPATAGSSARIKNTLTVSAANPLSFSVSVSRVSGGQSWLSVLPSGTLTTPQSLTVSVNPSNLAAATYTGTIYIRRGENTSIRVPVTLTVSPVTKTNLSWVVPAAIPYGTALSAAQLNASSGGVAGTFAYSPAAGAVLMAGSHVLSVTFTPTDTAHYTSATASTSINVNPASLRVTASNASRIYGAANPAFMASYSGFVNGDSASIVSGSPTLSTAATAASPVGNYAIAVTQGSLAASNYVFSFVPGTLTISRASTSVTWPAPAAISYGTALGTAQLDASTSVSGTFVYTPALGAVLTAGTHILQVAFNPADSTDYAGSTGTVTIVVKQGGTALSWAAPAAITYGTALSGTQLNASSGGVAGTLSYTPASGTVLTAGTQMLTVSFTPTDTVDYASSTRYSFNHREPCGAYGDGRKCDSISEHPQPDVRGHDQWLREW